MFELARFKHWSTEGCRMNNYSFKPIGIIHSPFLQPAGTPIQSRMAKNVEGSVEIFSAFTAGLCDLDGFDRIWLLYAFGQAATAPLLVRPFLDQREHGVFATRSPCRPNAIGMSCTRLLAVEGNRLRVGELDIVDGTPLLDIKPYVPAFDSFQGGRVGWLEGKGIELKVADERFQPSPENQRRS